MYKKIGLLETNQKPKSDVKGGIIYILKALKAFETAKDKLILEIGKDKCYELTQTQLIKKINKLDNKIPLIDFDLYY